jgi:hypothetical protein
MEYRTTDIVLAACLKMSGHAMDSIEVEGRRGTFVFINVPGEFIKDFNCGKIQVDPVSFHSMLRQLSTSVNRHLEMNRR